MTDGEWEDVLGQLRGIMGEHFHSWTFVVLTEDGDFQSDYTNTILGKMLLERALQDFKDAEEFELQWEDDDEWYEED